MKLERGTGHRPLGGGVDREEGVLQLDDGPVELLQLARVLHVILDEFRERRELLSAKQVVEVARVLDADVRHRLRPPAQRAYRVQTTWGPCY